jgi:hypothetical protein
MKGGILETMVAWNSTCMAQKEYIENTQSFFLSSYVAALMKKKIKLSLY